MRRVHHAFYAAPRLSPAFRVALYRAILARTPPPWRYVDESTVVH